MLKRLQKNSAIRRAPLVIYPYQLYSDSAKLLASSLRERLGRRVLRVGPNGRFHPRYGDWILNWGNTHFPDWATPERSSFPYVKWINSPSAVARSANKISTFNALAEKGISCVQYTSNKNVVQNWLDQGRIVFARTIITGSGGRGIYVVRKTPIPIAPLYTLYQRKDQEFRVHVFNGEVIDVAEKRRVREFEQSDDQKLIRNHDNGWVFCHNGINEPRSLRFLATESIRALGLDFGAVDILVFEGNCWILEVNTAPGIEETTLERYITAISKLLQ